MAKTAAFAVAFLAVGGATLFAQDASLTEQFAEREVSRSRRCVPALARMAILDEQLAPLVTRGGRLEALAAAVALEDSARVSPFSSLDRVEAAVRAWFVSDDELARQYLETREDSIQALRSREREQLQERLAQAMQEVATEGQNRMAAFEELPQSTNECGDAILIRSVVLEVCETTTSPVCEEAARTEPGERYAFVEAADDLWDIEEMRPWSEPAPLAIALDGGLDGGRTSVFARRGNVAAVVGLEPLIQERASLGEEEIGQFDANLDSLGFAFEDSRFVMAPALSIQLSVTEPLMGETHYMFHFGGLEDAEADVISTLDARTGEPLRAVVLAPRWALPRLASGEQVSLTAVRLPEGAEQEAEAIYTLALTRVGQEPSVTGLLSYMAGGQLGRDLTSLIPAEGPGGR